MALTATIRKAELQISDMDRHYYATHGLTLAQHPSETPERLMARLLAFCLFAGDALAFGKGLSTDAEPDLWSKAMTGVITQWIELGQPDEARIRKACGRAEQVVVVNYQGRASSAWWDKTGAALGRLGNVSVIDEAPPRRTAAKKTAASKATAKTTPTKSPAKKATAPRKRSDGS